MKMGYHALAVLAALSATLDIGSQPFILASNVKTKPFGLCIADDNAMVAQPLCSPDRLSTQ